jgi:hypothetical protein
MANPANRREKPNDKSHAPTGANNDPTLGLRPHGRASTKRPQKADKMTEKSGASNGEAGPLQKSEILAVPKSDKMPENAGDSSSERAPVQKAQILADLGAIVVFMGAVNAACKNYGMSDKVCGLVFLVGTAILLAWYMLSSKRTDTRLVHPKKALDIHWAHASTSVIALCVLLILFAIWGGHRARSAAERQQERANQARSAAQRQEVRADQAVETTDKAEITALILGEPNLLYADRTEVYGAFEPEALLQNVIDPKSGRPGEVWQMWDGSIWRRYKFFRSQDVAYRHVLVPESTTILSDNAYAESTTEQRSSSKHDCWERANPPMYELWSFHKSNDVWRITGFYYNIPNARVGDALTELKNSRPLSGTVIH